MKKKVIRLVSLLCCLVLVITTMAACGTKQSNQGNSTGQDEKDALPKENNEMVNYTIFKNVTTPGYPEDEGIAKKFIMEGLEKAGIKNFTYKLTVISGSSEYKTKLNLMVASGDTPDLFSMPDMLTNSRFADEGISLQLDNLLKVAPNYTKQVLSQDLEASKYNGKLYALPNCYRPEPFNSPNVNGFIGRGDWLTNLNLKMPETLDEFHNVMKAFTFNDPDKNGKNDTYGMSGAKGGIVGNFSGIFGAYGVVPSFWHERDGKLKIGLVLPETKAALKTLQEWYKEGIIDPDFAVIDNNQRGEKLVNSKIGGFAGQFSTCDIYNTNNASLRKIVPTASIVMFPAPKGSNGLRGWPDVKPGGSDMMAISAKTKDPVRLMKIVDWSVSEAAAPMLQFGREGQEWTYDKAANKINRTVENESAMYALGFGTAVRFVSVVDRRWMTQSGLDAVNVASKNILPNKFWDTVPAMFDYPDIGKLTEEYFTKIITGTLPVDAWDEFVQKYYAAGGKQIEEQVNAEWSKKKK